MTQTDDAADVDPIALARALIQRPSVTPADAGALDVLQAALEPLGFVCTRLVFEEPGAAPVDNLYARRGADGPHLCFAGHTDVVPAGEESAWRAPPFEARIEDGAIWGRGAADMKGAIAAFVAAAAAAIRHGEATGSLSLLITGDEEGAAVNGTRKMLQWAADRGETFDHVIVGEPTSVETLGDMAKVGRRGSVNCWLTVNGAQGHVAYPHRARNPIHPMLRQLLALAESPLDHGYDRFQPSSLQITDLHVGNPAHNVIPAKASARFNVRFNPTWTGASLEAFLRERLAAAAAPETQWSLHCIVSGEAFLTTDEVFIDLIGDAVEAKVGRRPELSTSGGTSDARFIKDFAPVAEFGLVGASMHKTDEHAAIDDIRLLTDIYREIIRRYFATS